MTSLPSLLVLTLLSTAATVPAGRKSSNWPGTAPDHQHPTSPLRGPRSATPTLVAQTAGSLQLSHSGQQGQDRQDSTLSGRWRPKRHSGGLSIDFPASYFASGRQQGLESIRKRVSAKLVSENSPRGRFLARRRLTPVGLAGEVKKRTGYRLCDMLGFPVSGGGCFGHNQIWAPPKTRSGTASEAREWPPMFLLGGAIGR